VVSSKHRGRQIRRGEVTIAFEVVGTGPTLLLHTGGLGDGGMWRDYIAELAGFRLVLLDHRGRGASSRPSDVQAHRVTEYVTDAAAVIEAVTDDAVGFVGYSMGAQVGYALAAERPDLVTALVGLGGVGDPPTGTAGDAVATDEVEDDVDELVAILRTDGVAGVVSLIEAEEGLTLPAWLRRQFLDTDAEQFALSLLAWRDWEPWSAFTHLRCPTLLVAGEDEDPTHVHELAAQRMANATAVWLPGRGHVGAFLDSPAVSAVMRPFLDVTIGTRPD
jgi:pimeloyl-ACP methyl ester carboxylesterase